jgi:hypothetical protein
MTYNTTRARVVADRQIRRLGGRVGAIKRGSAGTLIPIMVSVTEYSTREARGDLISPTDRRAVISTFKPDRSDLGTVPDKETDTIILYKKGTLQVEVELNIVQPPKLYDPGGVLCLIELQVRK